ncbi:MAG: DUF5678 domain-containing protein [Pirellulales bacterium]
MPNNNGRPKSSTQSPARPALDVAAFRGKWVAIDAETYKIVGHGASMEEARQSAPNIARHEPLLYFVPPSDAFFVGRAS